MGKSMTSPPCSVTEGYLWPNWGKHLLANLKWTNRKHSQTVKWRRRVGQRDVSLCGDSIPLWAQHPHNHSHHLENSLNPNIYALLRFQETGFLIEALVFGHWSESQCPSLFPEMQKLWTFILLIECWVFNLECLVFLQCVVIELYSRNHHLTYETEYISRVSGGLLHETGKGSNMEKIITVKRQQGEGPGDFCSILCFHPTSSFTSAVTWFPAVALLRGSTSFDFF